MAYSFFTWNSAFITQCMTTSKTIIHFWLSKCVNFMQLLIVLLFLLLLLLHNALHTHSHLKWYRWNKKWSKMNVHIVGDRWWQGFTHHFRITRQKSTEVSICINLSVCACAHRNRRTACRIRIYFTDRWSNVDLYIFQVFYFVLFWIWSIGN